MQKPTKMSHTVFRTAQIMPINHHQSIPTTTKALSSSPAIPFLPSYPPSAGYRLPPATAKVRKSLQIKAAASPSPVVVDGDAIASLERCFSKTAVVPASDICSSSSSSSHSVGPIVMKGGEKGAEFGSVKPVVLERGMPTMTMPKPASREKSSTPGLETGGGGGDIGNFINFGGGDGGDDDGDDDDYFDDFEDGDEGDEGGLFRRRMILPELFDRKFLEAVLNEWQKTMMDLPSGLRQAYEMGLLSSAQIVKYIAINARPTTARIISRALPEGLSRAFIGRMLADPSFLYRLLSEQAATIGCSVWWEVTTRKERIKQEWDLALINVLTVTACNAMVVWSLAPCRSYGNTFRFDLQNTLQKLPNNIFEKSYPLREFDLQKRIQSFFYKAAELCMVGLTAGATQGALSNLAASRKEGRLSVTIPTVSSNALGYGAFLGIYANLRYQLLCGFDKAVINHFDVIGVALLLGTTLRVMNTLVGETSRLAWLGVEVDPLAHSEENLQAYKRPVKAVDDSSSKWFISKDAIQSGLGLLGIKQGQSDSSTEAQGPKPRRKRIVRKKVAAS